MSEQLKESLSAMVDGEADDLEMRRVLKQMDSDLAVQWQRYQSLRQILTKEPGIADDGLLSRDITVRVAAAIADEPTPQLSTAADKTGRAVSGLAAWQRSAAGFAVAATVSLAVVWGWQNIGGTPIAPTLNPAVSVAVTDPSPESVAPAQPLMRSPLYAPATQRLQHSQWAATTVALNQRVIPRAQSLRTQASRAQTSHSGPVSTGRPDADVIRYTQADADRMNAYFVTHSGHAALNANKGMLPFARVVTLEPSRQPATQAPAAQTEQPLP